MPELFTMTTLKKGVCKIAMPQRVCTYDNGVWESNKISGISHIRSLSVDLSGNTWVIGERGDIVRLKDGEKNKKYTIQEAGTGQGKFKVSNAHSYY